MFCTHFYPLDILVEPPSNLVLKKIGSKWISILTVGFGAVTVGSAFMTNYGEFIAIRILLGCFEGGVLPVNSTPQLRYATELTLDDCRVSPSSSPSSTAATS